MILEPEHEALEAYYMVGDHTSDGQIDLYQILHSKTASGTAEIKVFDGSTGLRTLISKWVTEQPNYVGFGPRL